ncbi:hypothetical protein ACFPH6_32515 [Streptomyces xiangluensis]|uniref:Uncharacterized protein n=1 Tax=Streptomyces xiangluensis TaxID=2665720 RepID=A0ABV8YY56_9ACTN
MADDTDTDAWPGYTPEEMLPTDVVERIRLVCSLLHLPVAERHGMPGVALAREGVWKPGEPADHVTVCWNVSDKLFDAAETQGSDGKANHLRGAIDAVEHGLVDALRRGGLRVERASQTQDWRVLGIAGPSPLG